MDFEEWFDINKKYLMRKKANKKINKEADKKIDKISYLKRLG